MEPSSSCSDDTDSESSESSITSSSCSDADHSQGVSNIKELFLFTSKEESFPNLTETYPNLTSLIIQSQTVSYLTGIDTLAHLNNLWITECDLKDAVNAVGSCTSLTSLHLYSNEMTSIPNLSKLKHLQHLDLSDNKISTIEHMECLLQLQKLYLSDNYIKTIGSTLSKNQTLTDLDIAGNPIRSLHDLRNLAWNAALVSLACTNYNEESRCPVTLCCNYRSFVVHHLPRLVNLDSFPVNPVERKTVKEFYDTSIVYYNVLHHNYLGQHLMRATLIRDDDREMLVSMKHAHVKLKLRELEINQLNKRLKEKIPGPKQQISELSEIVSRWKDHMTQWKIKQENYRNLYEDQLNLELRSVGNLSFQRDNDDTFVPLCRTLIENFTCENLSRQSIKLDVKVSNAYRVVNNKCAEADESPEQIYLLLAKTFTSLLQVCDWFDNGWHACNEYELTTCLATADGHWLTDSESWDPTSYTENTRLAVILKLAPSTEIAKYTKDAHPSPLNQVSGTRISEPTCRTIRIADPKSIPSICVVEFHYSFDKVNRTGNDLQTSCRKVVNDIIDYHSTIKSVEILNADVLQRIVRHVQHPEPWNCLAEISLQGLELDGQFGDTTEQFVTVKTLDLSFNDIATFGFLARWFPNVRDLNLSYNKIKSLCTMQPLQDSLIKLDLSWNEIDVGRSCLRVLSKLNGKLECLDLSNNPLFDFNLPDHFVLIASQFLPLLKTTNKIDIEGFLQSVCVINLEDELEGNKGKIDDNLPGLIGLSWTGNLSEPQPSEKGDDIQDLQAQSRTWVSMRDKRAVQVSNQHANVAWADFTGNFITNLAFLENWGSLEELSLSRNVITTLDHGILGIQNIVNLDLSENYISTLGSMRNANFTSLSYLDVSNNKLQNFEGLQNCTGLKEIYATNNYISKLQDLVEIKLCRQLRVADVCGNEVSSLEEFSSFMVFHFRKLEYVNGKYVQENDLQDAFQLYGGTLDTDYLLRCRRNTELSNLKHISIAQCGIKKICLSAELLPCLETLNLEGNEITSLIGAHTLPALVSLNLGSNHIHSFSNEQLSEPCFPKLKSLYLNNNQIISLDTLKIWSFPSLALLFLQGNELQNIKGLRRSTSLKYLLIDRNKINSLTPEDCVPLKNIEELYVEGNKIRDLAFLKSVPNLTKLFVGHNKIEEHEQLRHLATLAQLRDLTLLGNPFCRVFHHYRQAIAYVPTLETLDGYSLDTNTFV